MISKSVTWQGEDPQGRHVEFSATVVRAGLIQTLKHDRLIYEGLQSADDDVDTRTARVIYFPNCLAPSIDVHLLVDGHDEDPSDFSVFCALPPEVIDLWASTSVEMNTRWRGKTPDQDDTEKKVTMSTDVSSTSTHEKSTTTTPPKTPRSLKSSI